MVDVKRGTAEAVDPGLVQDHHRHRKLSLVETGKVCLPRLLNAIDVFNVVSLTAIEYLAKLVEPSATVHIIVDQHHPMSLSASAHTFYLLKYPSIRVKHEGLLAVNRYVIIAKTTPSHEELVV